MIEAYIKKVEESQDKRKTLVITLEVFVREPIYEDIPDSLRFAYEPDEVSERKAIQDRNEGVRDTYCGEVDQMYTFHVGYAKLSQE